MKHTWTDQIDGLLYETATYGMWRPQDRGCWSDYPHEIMARELRRLAARVEELHNFRRDVSILLGLGVEAPPFEDVQARVWAYTGRVQELKARIATLEADNARLKQQRAADLADVAELEAENRELKSREKALRDALTLANETTRLHAKEAERLRNAVAGYEETIASNLREEDRLRADLAAAIRTGEELAKRNADLNESCDGWMHKYQETDAWRLASLKREGDLHVAFQHQRSRLARLDALLASEEPPAGLEECLAACPEMPALLASGVAWRWFRETLGESEGIRFVAKDSAEQPLADQMSKLFNHRYSAEWMRGSCEERNAVVTFLDGVIKAIALGEHVTHAASESRPRSPEEASRPPEPSAPPPSEPRS